MLFPDLFLVLFFWLHHAACRILVPHPGIKPKPFVVKLWGPNHQTSRKFPGSISCDWFYFLSCFLPFLIFYCKLNIMGPSVFRFLLSFWVRPIFEVFKTDFFFFFGLCSALHEISVQMIIHRQYFLDNANQSPSAILLCFKVSVFFFFFLV